MPGFSVRQISRRRGFQSKLFVIVDAAVFDVQAVEPAAVALLVPAHVVVEAVHVVGMGVGKRRAVILLDLGLELVEAPIGDQVFQPRDFAIGPIAEIALHFDDRRGHVDHLLGLDEGHSLGHGRKRFCGAGRHAHAAADQHVVADDFPIAADGHQAQIVGVQIDAIVARQADAVLNLRGK